MVSVELIRDWRRFSAGTRFETTAAAAEMLVARGRAKYVTAKKPAAKKPVTEPPKSKAPAKKKVTQARSIKKK